MALTPARGTFIVVATPGDFGKPRPALVVQSDLFSDLPSVLVVPLTSTLRDDADQFRLEVMPSAENGLREPSQLAIDKLTVIGVLKIGKTIGNAPNDLMVRVNQALAVFLGIV